MKKFKYSSFLSIPFLSLLGVLILFPPGSAKAGDEGMRTLSVAPANARVLKYEKNDDSEICIQNPCPEGDAWLCFENNPGGWKWLINMISQLCAFRRPYNIKTDLGYPLPDGAVQPQTPSQAH